MPDYLPRSDEALKQWCANFASQLVNDPTRYHVAPEMAEACRVAVEAFTDAMAVASAPGTRTTVAVSEKDRCREVLVRQTRAVAMMIKARPLPAEDMIVLGLRPRATRYRRIGRPTHAPSVRVLGVNGSTLTVQLQDDRTPSYHGLPKDVSGARVVYFAGDDPPSDRHAWRSLAVTSRMRFRRVCGERLAPGTRVWIAAQWWQKDALGPMSMPVMAYIHYPELHMTLTPQSFPCAA